MSTITGKTVTSTVTLGSGTYGSSLTIASDGAVDPTAPGNAIYGAGAQTWAVYNYGTVAAGNAGIGIDLVGGGTIVNGSTSDTTALISGRIGIDAGATATVTNYGTILGSSGAGVQLGAGGNLAN